MWTYRQSTGEMLDPFGKVIGVGYAGHGLGVNNVLMQNVPDVGPLPQGKYTIGPMLDKLVIKPPIELVWCSRLDPDQANEMFQRSGFLIHGGTGDGLRDASEGCIVLGFNSRMLVLKSKDRELQVVP